MTIPRMASGAALLAALVLAAPPVRAQDQGTMDHAAMASDYQAEAKEAQAKAASHQLMLDRYKNMPMLPKGSPVTRDQMVKHCQKLVDSYKETATEAGDLAKAHQSMAQPAK